MSLLLDETENTTHNHVPLLDLAGLLDVDVKPKISIAKNATYTSDKNHPRAK